MATSVALAGPPSPPATVAISPTAALWPGRVPGDGACAANVPADSSAVIAAGATNAVNLPAVPRRRCRARLVSLGIKATPQMLMRPIGTPG